MTPEYEITDQTRGVTRRTRDLLLLAALHLLWLSWGHVVLITRMDAGPASSSSPTLPVPRD